MVMVLSRLHSCTGCSLPSFFLTKKKGEAKGDFEGQMYPLLSISFKNTSRATCSSGLSGYILQLLEGPIPSFRSMAWSYFRQGGRSWEACSSNTFRYSR